MRGKVAPNDLHGWSTQIGLEACGATNLTLGLVNGNRDPIDRRVIDQIARTLTDATTSAPLKGRLLVLRQRFDVLESDVDHLHLGAELTQPMLSPLGNWATVDIVPPRGKALTNLVEGMARQLPLWKPKYQVILMDLGPIHGNLSRAMGYLCDGTYILLGPESCGSPDWLRQQILRHEQAGSAMSGTITVAVSRAA